MERWKAAVPKRGLVGWGVATYVTIYGQAPVWLVFSASR